MRLSVRSGGGDREASAGPLSGRSRGQRAVRKLALAAVPAAASPPKPVTCGDPITAPGQYFLASDCTGEGIRIAASDVHLKLDGHTTGAAAASPLGSGRAASLACTSRGRAPSPATSWASPSTPSTIPTSRR